QFSSWVRITGFRVAGFFQIAMLPDAAIQREHRGVAFIEAHVGNFFTIRAPPVRAVVGRSTINFLPVYPRSIPIRSEEQTSELQSRENLESRLLLEKKKNILLKV